MSEPSIKEKLQKLKETYAAQLPVKIDLLEKQWVELSEDPENPERLKSLLREMHTLAGSSASFGFKGVSIALRDLEAGLKGVAEKGLTSGDLAALPAFEILGRMKAACAAAGKGSDVPQDTSVVYVDSDPGEEMGGVRNKIFLVEDDPDVRESLALQISHFGYEVKSFADLGPLKEEMKRSEPSVIIMDMVFPEGDLAGAKTVAAIQEGRETKIPVIFISVRNDFTARLQAVRAGGDAYMVKPVNIGPLMDKLDALTRKEVVEPYRILIIDDDVDLSSYYSLILQEGGITTYIVNDPRTALASIIKFNPDLILMDMYMPQCSGVELAKVIRSMDTYVSIPIVFLSAETSLSKQLTAMSMGGDDFLTKPIQPCHLISSVVMRAERMRIIRSFMDRDSLTGLLNHSKAKEQLDIAAERVRRHGGNLAFAMIDLDHFKAVNDTYGHTAGDRVIMSLARLLQQRLRKTDVVGRYGGEEFAVILNDTGPDDAFKVLDSIRLSFSQIKHQVEGREFSATFSCGVANYSDFGDPVALCNAADNMLYEAKNNGRNCVILKR
jgi:diguanylate cyclase (GGDEF)-like protein